MGIAWGTVGVISTGSSANNKIDTSERAAGSKLDNLTIIKTAIVVTEVLAAIAVSLLTLGTAAPEAAAAAGAGVAAEEATGVAVGEVISETAVEGISDVVVDGTVEGATEGAVDGVSEGVVDGTTETAKKSFEIPKVFTRGQGVVLQTGVALAGAGANLGVSIAGKQVNAVATGIDFASALLPGLSELTGGIKNVYKANKIVSRISKGERAMQFASAAEEGVLNTAKVGSARASALDAVANKALKNETINVVKEIGDMGFDGREAAILIRIVGDKEITKDGLKAIARKLAQETNIEEAIALKKLDKILKLSDNLDKLNIGFRTTKDSLVKQIQELTGIEKEELVKAIWFSRRPSVKIQEYIANDVLENISTELVGQDAIDSWEALMRLAETGKASDIEKAAKLLLQEGTLDAADRAVFGETQEVVDALLLSNGKYQSQGSKAIRFFGSRKFNDYVVQPTQAIVDPGDLGRAPVEFAYRQLKRKIEKMITNRALKKGVKVLGKLNTLEEKLIEAGWKPMIGSYLWMLKVLPGGIPTQRLAIMKFRPDNTAGGRGLNKNGKPDVLIRISDVDIARLEAEGSSYWWSSHGRKKGWWYSRGGRRKFTGVSNQLSEGLSLFLGFVPVNALRNWLSITSNVVENFNSVARGNYAGTYLARLERSFMRSAINRSIRLGSRVVLGGVATKLTNENSGQVSQFLFGKAYNNGVVRSGFVGREMQRFAVAAAQAFESTSDNGLFAIKTQGYAGRLKSSASLGGVTSVRSNLLRQARRRGVATNITQSVGYTRKFGQVRRIGSAVTPNTVYNSRNVGRIKL